MNRIDKFRGCLIGGAVGDALGYAVEFLSADQIVSKYGASGITAYKLENGIAQISDDTQMMLFTANGLLLGTTRCMTRGIMGDYRHYVAHCYQDWLKTQVDAYPCKDEHQYSWLINIPELFARRAPGNTCLTALRAGGRGTIEQPINQSKGCGGIMRIAPVGLYFGNKQNYTQEQVDRIGAEVAAITHGHELGYLPAAVLVHIISLLVHHDDIPLHEAVKDAMAAIGEQFANATHLDALLTKMQKAIDLVSSQQSDVEAIHELGEGWVAEETLAIAIYCALKYPCDFEEALIAAVNHDGDSDSTGAVTGNILGAYLGWDAIPAKYIDDLELKNVILEIADDLYHDCQMTEYGSYYDEIWMRKYINCTYAPTSSAGA